MIYHKLFIFLPPFSVLSISFFIGCIIWDNQARQNIHDLCMCLMDIYEGPDFGIYGGLHGQVSFVISSFVHVASGHVQVLCIIVSERVASSKITQNVSAVLVANRSG